MKRILMVVLMLFLVLLTISCVANPAILVGGNPEPYVESEWQRPELNTLPGALRPYIEAWGPYDGYHIMSSPAQGTAAGFYWLDSIGQVIRYVVFDYQDEMWTVYDASKIIGIEPASTS